MRAQRKRVICCAVLGAALVVVLIKASWGYGSDDPMKGKSLAVATNAQDSGDPWKRVAVATTASFRGLCAVSADIVWASGTGGTVIRTTDGGKSWAVRTVAGAENQDFRGIRAFDAENAIIMSTGNAEKGLARIYRTSDGGQNWALVFETKTTGIFFDSIAFWDQRRGIVLSDPVDGHFILFRTDDGGTTWKQIPPASLPPALKGDGSFAASNSCIALQGERNIWFVTGGASVARVVRSNDGGKTWAAAETPIHPVNASTGLFSIAFSDAKNGVAVGGDYAKPEDSPPPTIIRTSDGGETWQVMDEPTLPQKLFLSSVAFIPQPGYFTGVGVLRAVGPAGAVLQRFGRPWTLESRENFNDVANPDAHVSWAVGPKGFVARLDAAK